MSKSERAFASVIGIVIVFLFSIILFSCKSDRYELSKDEQGRIIRLDKETGAISIVDGERLLPVKTPEQQESEAVAARAKEKALGEPKQWSDQDFKQIGITKASLTTKWIDGTLWYKLELQPIPRNFYESYTAGQAPFVLKFKDSSGFELVKVDLYKSAFESYVDENGKRVALSANSSTPCTRSVYEELVGWGLTWKF